MLEKEAGGQVEETIPEGGDEACFELSLDPYQGVPLHRLEEGDRGTDRDQQAAEHPEPAVLRPRDHVVDHEAKDVGASSPRTPLTAPRNTSVPSSPRMSGQREPEEVAHA